MAIYIVEANEGIHCTEQGAEALGRDTETAFTKPIISDIFLILHSLSRARETVNKHNLSTDKVDNSSESQLTRKGNFMKGRSTMEINFLSGMHKAQAIYPPHCLNLFANTLECGESRLKF